MFSQQEHLTAWLYYLLGSGLFLLAWWWLCRRIAWREVRAIARITAIVIALTPWYSLDDQAFLAPAWLTAGIDALAIGPDAFWRAGYPLVLVLAVSLTCSMLYFLVIWLRGRLRQRKAS
ncbi:MAG: hypothetical protein COA42_14480 [Alteromonadaceae bacterium]|nr:MAG: hypothetical protein COA42_14480 [Alteromonadaceae bacterium]